VLDSGAEGPRIKSLSGNSLGQTVHTHRASVDQAAKLVAALLRVARLTAGLAEKQPTAWFMTHVTCRLTAKNRDQLRDPTLGNRVWATFTFTLFSLQTKNHATQMRLSLLLLLVVVVVVVVVLPSVL